MRSKLLFFVVLLTLLGAAIIRSSITTSLDSFTYDEAYHIGAGAVHIQTGDFRLNPEQPPLTKVWVGSYVSLLGFQVSPLRPFADKEDERGFVEIDTYQNNDPFVVQTRARTAMFALNGLLLFFFGLAVRSVFGDVPSMGAVLFLAIDPTVAAHLPVVMTDLPVALASGIAALASARAFQTWKPLNLIAAALGLGVALSAKHSGIITLVAITLIGSIVAVLFSGGAIFAMRLRRLAAVGAIVIGGIVVLWAFYAFQFHEAPGTSEETFNRPLADKISDVRSPVYRTALNAVALSHAFPRAYVWGLADTIRAGVEGRAIQVRAFGHVYYAKAPFYFFPGIVAAKLPIGLLLLSLIGAGFLAARKLPPEYFMPAACLAGFSAIFLFFLIRGSSYAGVRHALPLFPLMAVLGAFAIAVAARKRTRLLGGTVALSLLGALVSALPQMRPWEYFNEMAGGAANGYLYFNDEGVDLSQRIGEAANYYHRELEPIGEIPFLAYFSNATDRKARGMDWVGREPLRDAARYEPEMITGTFLIGANELGETMWWDVGRSFRGTEPAGRMGNIFVFRGTFPRPTAMRARSMFYRSIFTKIYTNEPDIAAGIEGIESSLAMDDSFFFVALELGNQYLKLGRRDDALRAYKLSYERAPTSDSIYDLLRDQIQRLETEPLENIPMVRNPGIE
ncbi:MAG: hypothetical protein ABI857_08185 [Acidobacteriota bacterium]